MHKIFAERWIFLYYCHVKLLPFVRVFHKGWHGTDLYGVGVIGWVLKQAVVRVEQFPRNQEEKLTGRPTVVKSATKYKQRVKFCEVLSNYKVIFCKIVHVHKAVKGCEIIYAKGYILSNH